MTVQFSNDARRRRAMGSAASTRDQSSLITTYSYEIPGAGTARRAARERTRRPRKSKLRRAIFWSAGLLLTCSLIVLLLSNDHLDSLYIHRAVADLKFEIRPGASAAVRFPHAGPYDKRLGYTLMPSLILRLKARNFEIVNQAVQSPALVRFIEAGGYAVYHEKSQAGLVLTDSSGRTLEATSFPSAVYRRFEEIPPLLINTLRFIEDRGLLNPKDPYRNPAVEWHRLARAAAGQLGGLVNPRLRRGGASTLATQIEKYRHSPDGRTDGIAEKMRQIATATARAYLDGYETIDAQRDVVTAYLDSTPLGSRPAYGEVVGLGDAMSAWFGVDLVEAKQSPVAPACLRRRGRAPRSNLQGRAQPADRSAPPHLLFERWAGRSRAPHRQLSACSVRGGHNRSTDARRGAVEPAHFRTGASGTERALIC